MTWFYAEDNLYYADDARLKLKEKYNLDEIIPFAKYNDLCDHAGKNIALMAPYLPSDFDGKMKNSNYFSVEELPNKYGVLTSGQHKAGVKESDVMEQRYGVSLFEPYLT
ncbi:MAG TPA: hypothetical protein ENK75_05835, partial [Saprospiraceae bacterium]|nr:hypothetical protein [Saprospiraceae bacterium]